MFDKYEEVISVIIPVYNVEKYLRQCLDSVLFQSYKKIEIILVDDGSTDSSASICDEYEKKDNRIRVIHKENGGQSSARNTALDIVKGDYVFFLDSDDWIAYETLETLYAEMKNSKTDCVYMEANIIDESGSIIDTAFEYYEQKTVLSSKEYLNLLLEEKIGSQPCLVLFRAKYWENIRYPVGRIYEDIATVYKVADGMKGNVVFVPRKFYHYRMNTQGTSLSSNILKKQYHRYLAFKERYEFACLHNMQCQKECLTLVADCGIGVINYFVKNNIVIDLNDCYKDAYEFLKNNFKKIICLKSLASVRKVMLILSMNIKLYHRMYKLVSRFISVEYEK